MPQSQISIHCINPDCPRPASKTGKNKFCQSCGAPIVLNHRYVPLKKLGSGGFAVTYAVYDLKSQTERVLKVLLETSPQALRLFEQEVAVLASLRHPGIPRVEPDSYFAVKVGKEKGRLLPCLVMEKINGQTLEQVLDQYPQGCPEALVLDWLAQAVEILRVLHSRQIVHRDLKPANFMLRSHSRQLVAIDFGGAKQIGVGQSSENTSTRLVSPGYSPPEQIAGAAVGPTADFYALGRTVIHLLTGRYPPEMDDPLTGECRWHAHAKVSQGLAKLINEMVMPGVQERPASATEIQGRLAKMARVYRRRRIAIARVQAIGNVAKTLLWPILKVLRTVFSALGGLLYRAIARAARSGWGIVRWVTRACSDTLLGMLLGGFGGGAGALVGFALAYWLPVGDFLSDFFFRQFGSSFEPTILLYTFAGLGTALGLTEAGSFGQWRRFGIAGFMGSWGYLLGWWSLHLSAIAPAAKRGDIVMGLMEFTAIAIAFVTLGLGLGRPHLLHTAVTAIGSAATVGGLIYLKVFPFLSQFLSLFQSASPSWPQFWASIVFFAILGSTGAFCLGASYYLLVPFLRFLGLR